MTFMLVAGLAPIGVNVAAFAACLAENEQISHCKNVGSLDHHPLNYVSI